MTRIRILLACSLALAATPALAADPQPGKPASPPPASEPPALPHSGSPSAAPTPSTAAAAAQAPAPTAKVSAEGIMGRKVMGPDNKEIGRVVDVLVDAGSNPRAAVIDFGGFLGVGSRKVAVNWSDLTFPPTGSDADIKLDLTANQIREAPAYTDQTKPASVVEPPPITSSSQPTPPPAPPPPSTTGH